MSNYVNMKISLLFFVFFLWFSVTPITSFAAWTIETVDSAGDVGFFTSIAADSNNNVHISYYDGSNRNLKYATNASGSWVTETVDNGLYVGWFTSIATDSNNNVHISYLDVYHHGLKYAMNASGSWVTETVDNVLTELELSSEYTSIAIDRYNMAHISYYDLGRGLMYATNFLGSWFTQSVDSAGVYVGMGNSIALDSGFKGHISYFGNGDLKYATGYPPYGGVVIQTVDTAVYVLLYFSAMVNTSIATDSNNHVHISYYDAINDDLKYATNASGSWVTQTVDSTGGGYNSITIDSSNKVHISYFANGDLKYAKTGWPYGSWVTETVDSGVGEYTSIAVDSNNKVHISYYDAINGDLKYAAKNMDTTAPTTTASPAGGTYSSAQSVTLTCNDGSGSGCKTTYYCLGSGCYPTTIYNGSISISSSTVLRFSSFDNADNPESVKTETYTISTTANGPFIDKILGIKKPGLIVGIIGTNFSSTQGNSIVHIGPKTFNSSSPRIKLWSDTKVRIRLPNYQCGWFKGQDYRYIKVWVTVDGVDSNKKRIKILKPDTCP